MIPHLPAAVLFERHLPLRQFLEREFERPVDLYGAPDYRTHVARLVAGAYDLALTGPQFLKMARETAGFEPVVTVGPQLSVVIIVPEQATPVGLAELRGQRIGMSDPLSLSSIVGRVMLRRAGLDGDAYASVNFLNNTACLRAMARGDIQACVIAKTSMANQPVEPHRTLATSPAVPAVYMLAHPRLHASLTPALASTLQRFPGSAEGKRFFLSTPPVVRPALPMSSADRQAMDELDQITRRVMVGAAA